MTLALVVAYLLRFEFLLPEAERTALLVQLPLVVALQLTTLHFLGVNSFVWRYIGLAEITAFAKAALISMVVLVAVRFGLPDSLATWKTPFSVILFDTALAYGGVLALRVSRRLDFERIQRRRRSPEQAPGSALLIGAGSAGVATAREIHRHPEMGIVIEGFVDDDSVKQGSRIHGIPVIGTTQDLAELVPQLGIEQVIVTLGDAEPADMRRIAGICEAIPIRALVIPGLHEVIGGKVEIRRMRDIAIEDLLGRQQVALDSKSLQDFLQGKVVLVTGGGGSIGSELARQVLGYSPEKLILVERSEAALFEIDRELRDSPMVVSVIADSGDRARISSVLAEHRPQVVFHAAAYKHVSLMEENVREAVRNNVLGTASLAQCCAEAEVAAFVLISTDKAVRPTSIMGATKRVAELTIQAYAQTVATRFVAVRFGNVLGSTGSVVPIFRQQIDQGGPVTVTHPEVERYFMTPSEAAQLVLQAGAIGESGQILILDMGNPVRIVDLAEDMIRLSGLKPHHDIAIEFTGLRAGEKLEEELSLAGEQMERTLHPKISNGRIEPVDADWFFERFEQLKDLSETASSEVLRAALAEVVPESSLLDTDLEPAALAQ